MGLFPPLSLSSRGSTIHTWELERCQCQEPPAPRALQPFKKWSRVFSLFNGKKNPFTKMFISMNISIPVLTPQSPHRTFP